MEDNPLIILRIEDDLNLIQMEDNLNIFENGRRPQYFCKDDLNIFAKTTSKKII